MAKLQDQFQEDMAIEGCFGFAEGLAVLTVIAAATVRARVTRAGRRRAWVWALVLGGAASLTRWGIYAAGVRLPFLIDFGVAVVVAILAALIIATVQWPDGRTG